MSKSARRTAQSNAEPTASKAARPTTAPELVPNKLTPADLLLLELLEELEFLLLIEEEDLLLLVAIRVLMSVTKRRWSEVSAENICVASRRRQLPLIPQEGRRERERLTL